MRYYLSALFLLVCFELGSSLGQSKDPLPDVNLEIQELSPDFPDGLYLLCSARRVRPVEYGEFSR